MTMSTALQVGTIVGAVATDRTIEYQAIPVDPAAHSGIAVEAHCTESPRLPLATVP